MGPTLPVYIARSPWCLACPLWATYAWARQGSFYRSSNTSGRSPQAFIETDNRLREQSGFDTVLSGSTGNVACIQGRSLSVANLGDSRCLLGSLDRLGNLKTRCVCPVSLGPTPGSLCPPPNLHLDVSHVF